MKEKDLITSSLSRVLRITGLVGQVGTSVLGKKTLDIFRSKVNIKAQELENLATNANRIVETLGKMKGGAMKVGQMLSLQEGLLPPEIAQILGQLQKEAPAVPFKRMNDLLKRELKEKYNLFESIDPVAHAAASIGQVHKGKLKDGRIVAIKIQYPKMYQIIKADLKNLKTLLGNLFALFIKIDLDPVWEELEERLLEEIDYEHEASNIELMRNLHQDVPEIIIPDVIREVSSKRVLTMEFVEGISARDKRNKKINQKLKNKWGETLFNFIHRGLFVHHALHADPNFSNFSMLEDGRIIVYDFGCIKKVPPELSNGIKEIIQAVIKNQNDQIPKLLKKIGVFKVGHTELPQSITDPYVDQFKTLVRVSPPYSFKQNDKFIKKILDLDKMFWNRYLDVCFPKDIVFINRTFAGHFGNLGKLGAQGPWRKMIESYL